MSRVSRRGLVCLTLSMLLFALALPTAGIANVPRGIRMSAGVSPAAAQRAAVASNYGQLPLSFELNQGQAALPVRFLAHGSSYALALTPGAALLALQSPPASSTQASRFRLPGQPALPTHITTQPPSVVGMQWLGANPNPTVTGEGALPGTVNYFIGNDPAQWHTNIPTYQQVRLHNVYPGVDLVYYGKAGQLEYDFVVAPGADPARISLGFTGASRVGVDLQGNLSLTLPGGTLQQDKPLIYQTVNGARQTIAGGYTLTASQRASFTLGAYNPRLPLVIDPSYKFSTYLGGSGTDYGQAIAVDASGDAYVTGSTNSPDFPLVNPYQSSFSSYAPAFVSKFNASGTALIYSTYLGGSMTGGASGSAIAVDSNGDAYITGDTNATDFPTTPGAFQTTNKAQSSAFGTTTFVTKFNASGTALAYSTYLGGNGGGNSHNGDNAYAITVDSDGDAYVTGTTQSTDFPTANALQATYNSANGTAYVTKFNATGTALVYSTYLGGSTYEAGKGIAVNASGNAYVTGNSGSTNFPTTAGTFQTSPLDPSGDPFVTEFSTTGTTLLYSTYLGGSGYSNSGDQAYGIAVDTSGDAYVTGDTVSSNFPTTPGAFQTTFGSGGGAGEAFVTKLNTTGTALVYSTYLGGGGAGGNLGDGGQSIAVDSNGDAYVTGVTYSINFPTANPLQPNLGSFGTGNAFVSKFNAAGSSLLFSTYLGGSTFDSNICRGSGCNDIGNGIAVGADGTAYIVGSADSTDFPTVNAYQPTYLGYQDAFVTKIATLPSMDTTTGVFRPSNGNLYLKNSNSTGYADITLDYGLPGDQPITGDWTGKGYKSIGIYRNGTFYLRNSNTTGYANITVAFGASGDIPVAGDWTGKGYDSIGYYQPSNSTFYLRDSNTPGPADHVARLGISGDVPIVGDWTGKGWDSIGVFRPSNGIVYLRNSNTTGYADINFVYGIAGDKPVVGDWTAQGKDTIGVDRNGEFLLRNSNSTGPANIVFYLGVSGDDPIAGPWLAPASSPPPVHRGPSGSGGHTPTPAAGQPTAATTSRRTHAAP